MKVDRNKYYNKVGFNDFEELVKDKEKCFLAGHLSLVFLDFGIFSVLAVVVDPVNNQRDKNKWDSEKKFKVIGNKIAAEFEAEKFRIRRHLIRNKLVA